MEGIRQYDSSARTSTGASSDRVQTALCPLEAETGERSCETLGSSHIAANTNTTAVMKRQGPSHRPRHATTVEAGPSSTTSVPEDAARDCSGLTTSWSKLEKEHGRRQTMDCVS